MTAPDPKRKAARAKPSRRRSGALIDAEAVAVADAFTKGVAFGESLRDADALSSKPSPQAIVNEPLRATVFFASLLQPSDKYTSHPVVKSCCGGSVVPSLNGSAVASAIEGFARSLAALFAQAGIIPAPESSSSESPSSAPAGVSQAADES